MLTPLAAFLRVSDVPETPILLLALASTLGQIFLVILSLVALRNVAPGLTRTLLRPCVDGTVAAVAGVVAAHTVLAFLGDIVPLTTLMNVFMQGLASGIAGLLAAAAALYLIGNKEFEIIANVLGRLLRSHEDPSIVLEPSAEDLIQP